MLLLLIQTATRDPLLLCSKYINIDIDKGYVEDDTFQPDRVASTCEILCVWCGAVDAYTKAK